MDNTVRKERRKTALAKTDDISERGSLKSMRKLMVVLDCFSRYDKSLSLSEISERCGMPKTTVHRLVTSLREVKFLEQDRGRDRYRMGIRLFELGSNVLGNLDVFSEARPYVDRLMKATGEGSHLCVFDGTNMVSVEHLEPNNSSANWTTTLSISPSYCTGVGKAALAYQDKATIDKIIKQGLMPYTPNTITDPAELRKELRLIARQGYALDEREHQPNVRCVAAPIYNTADRVFAAVSVSGPADRLTPERVPTIAPLVIAIADQISRLMGHNPNKS